MQQRRADIGGSGSQWCSCSAAPTADVSVEGQQEEMWLCVFKIIFIITFPPLSMTGEG